MRVKQRVTTILSALILSGLLGSASVFAADWKILPGHVPHEVSGLSPLTAVPGTNQLRLAIGVPLRAPAALDHYLDQVYDAASTNYHRYLTPQEFTDRFGPSEQDYEAVQQFARGAGLTIVQTHSNRLVLDVMGPAAAVERALHISLHYYRHPAEQRHFFAPDAEPSVAASLPVADVQGLSDFTKPHPRLKKGRAASSPKSGSGSGGAYLGNDFRNAYAAGTTLTGAGQMVGLLQFDGFYASDISAYAAAAGGGRSAIVVQPVLLDGFDGLPTTGPDSGDSEVSLDIEMVMAMAPGLSKIMVFEAGPNGFQNDVLNAMAQNSGVKSLSCSWGWGGGPSTTTDNIFKELAAQGQSFFNASGDSDAFTVGAHSANGVDDPSGANAPSSSPYITQVGGTTLTMSGAGSSFSTETVWNWGGGSGSSGGVSSYYSIPSWQSGLSMTANLGSTTQRNIPDVAMTADNVEVYDSNGSQDVFGGTSCSAPLWAGFIALVNQQAASLGNASAGFINPAIYAIGKGQNAGYSYAACFHDTTSGNNFWSGSPSKYPAVSGYDLCTGWGTPKGVSLINALAGGSGPVTITTNSSPAAGLTLGPLTGFAFTGPMGGAFTPASGTFQLTNTSAAPAAWALVSTSAWLKAAAVTGSVPANATASVIAALTTTANTLKPAAYSSSLAFTNRASHTVQRIPVTLQVQQPLTLVSTQGFTAIGPVSGPFNPILQSYSLVNASSKPQAWSLVKTSTWLTASLTTGSVSANSQSNLTVALASSVKTLKAGVYRSTIRFTGAGGTFAVVPFTLSVGQPLIVNGGFETGSFSGWTQSGNTEYTSVMRGSSVYLHSGSFGAALGPSGSPGYLSQTVSTVAGQTYLLSLWLRNSNGGTPNFFEIQWNGGTVLYQSDFSNRTWTNLQVYVTAGTTSSMLQLGFQDDPAYLSLDDVSLTPVASAAIKAAVQKSRDFQLVWGTVPGTIYQLQYKTNLCQGDWLNLGAPVSAAEATLTLADTNALSAWPQRFYRLLTVPKP